MTVLTQYSPFPDKCPRNHTGRVRRNPRNLHQQYLLSQEAEDTRCLTRQKTMSLEQKSVELKKEESLENYGMGSVQKVTDARRG